MKVLSNFEFKELAEGVSTRLKYIAKTRYENDPYGFLTMDDLDKTILASSCTGDKKSTKWLKNVKSLKLSGKLDRVRKNTGTYEEHVAKIHALYKKGEIDFDIGTGVVEKESGKRGTIVDYKPEDKTYIVALNPFEIKELAKKDLQRVG